jgi:predicted secreted protein
MPISFNRIFPPTQTTTLSTYTLEIGDIADTQNPDNVTIVTDAIALAGDTLVRVKRPNTGSISLPAGAAVIFDSIDIGISYTQMVSIVENVYIDGNTPEADLFIKVAPLTELLPDGAIAVTVNGLLPLFGVQSFDIQSQETTVDVTNSQSGSGMESAIVRFNRNISVSGVQMEGDRTVETLLKPRVFSQWGDDKELYAIATYPDGSKYEGPAKVLNFNMAGNQNEVMRYEFTLQFQRDTQRKTSLLPWLTLAGWGELDLSWGDALIYW